MEPVLRPMKEILDLNADLVLNCVDGLSELEASTRVSPNVNGVSYLLAHLIDARYYLAGLLGAPLENPHEEAFRDVTTMDDAGRLPALADMKENWRRVSAHVASSLENATAESLALTPDITFPVSDRTALGGIAFLVQHESYHLGQLGLIRKALGHEGVSYDRSLGMGDA